MDTLNHTVCMHTARFDTVGFYTRWQVLVQEGQIGQILTLVHGFYTRRPSSYACWLVGKLLCSLASSYACWLVLMLVGKLLCLLTSSYARWQALMLVGQFLCLLASSYTTSVASDDIMHHKMKHSQDSGLRSALAVPWAASPYFRNASSLGPYLPHNNVL